MRLLTNNHTRYAYGRLIMPAVFGPYVKTRATPRINVSMVLAATYSLAAVVIALDLFVWRA